MEVKESDYLRRVLNYNVDAYVDSEHKRCVQQALNDNNDSYQTMLFYLEQALTKKDRNIGDAKYKSAEIINRIRTFNESVSDEVVQYNVKPLDYTCRQRIGIFCQWLRQFEERVYREMFEHLLGLFSKEEFRLLIRLGSSTKYYNELVRILELGQQQGQPAKVDLKMMMMQRLANNIKYSDNFDDYKRRLFNDLIDSAANESKIELEKVEVRDLEKLLLVTSLNISFELKAQTLNLSVVEQGINNPNFHLNEPNEPKGNTLELSQLVNRLKAHRNCTDDEKFRNIFDLEKAYRSVVANQLGKGPIRSSFQCEKMPVVPIDSFEKRIDALFNALEGSAKNIEEILRNQFKEYTRKIEMRKLAICLNSTMLPEGQRYTLVGDSQEWGLFVRDEDCMYFVTNTLELKKLADFRTIITSVRRSFRFNEEEDPNLAQLNRSEQHILKVLDSYKVSDKLKDSAREMIMRIKVQLCLRCFERSYKQAQTEIAGRTIKLNTAGLNPRCILER